MFSETYQDTEYLFLSYPVQGKCLGKIQKTSKIRFQFKSQTEISLSLSSP